MSKLKLTTISILIIALVAISGYLSFNYFHNRSPNLTNVTRSKIRIGYTPTASSLGVFVAQEKDYFKDQGLKVELIEFQSSNLMTDAIIRGDIDSGCCTGIIAPLEANIVSPNKIKLFTVGDESKKAPWNQLIVK